MLDIKNLDITGALALLDSGEISSVDLTLIGAKTQISFTKSNDLLFFDGSNTYITSIQKETALKLIEKLLEMNPKLNIPDE